MTQDYQSISQSLLPAIKQLLPVWLPDGKFKGKEYVCGNLKGGNGDSLSVNTQTGIWADFATGDKGKDIISLYAAINNMTQSAAAKKLSSSDTRNIGLPPPNAPNPDWGKPSGTWAYKTEQGRLIGYITRFDVSGKKQFVPWAWDLDTKSWQKGGFKTPRPLYGLELLSHGKHVMIVEGEKACDAARQLTDIYTVMTWPGGVEAVNNIDWSPLIRNKCNILLWPDADDAGKRCMDRIAGILKGLEIKIIDVSGQPPKWDAADVLAEGLKFTEWAKPRVSIYIPADKEKPADVNIYTLYEDLHLTCNAAGQPKKNIDNVLKILEGYDKFKDIAWYDEFHDKIFTSWESRTIREWQDDDDIRLTVIYQRTLGMHQISDDIVSKAVRSYAIKNMKNEVKDYMESLTWDRQERISHCFEDGLGAAENAYSRAVSQNFWLAMVARIYQPGCKYDNMVILEGKQGIYKSTALNIIGGKWYTELNQNISSTDFCLAIQGKLLIEIAELDSFSKAETSKIKQVISRQVDRYRVPYARATLDHPRQCVFVGTTNEDSYLKDPTGARRFWPVKIGQIRLDILRNNRDQYFAEAVVKYKATPQQWWIDPPCAAEEQEKRHQEDVWESVIAEYIKHYNEIQISEILTTTLKIEIGKQDKPAQMRVAHCLKRLGWIRTRVRRNRVVCSVWLQEAE